MLQGIIKEIEWQIEKLGNIRGKRRNMAKCKECEGKGYIPTRATLGKQRMPWRIYNKECPRCKGTGIEPKDKKEGEK
jgi:DnaJ-class molecular chaperone